MQNQRFPFAVRFIGFSDQEATSIEACFEHDQDKGHAYLRLPGHSLQDPDLYLANGADLKAMAVLSALNPGDVRPALLVGAPSLPLPFPYMERPIRWDVLFNALDHLVERRADALSKLAASNMIAVPERRLRDRLDIDLTDPEIYLRMRNPTLPGGILIVDKSGAFCQFVAEMLARQHILVNWVSDEGRAVRTCKEQSTLIVMINTSTPEIDPYRLCKSVKTHSINSKTAVIFLVGKPFEYNFELASRAGSDGSLSKPLAANHLLAALKKFLP